MEAASTNLSTISEVKVEEVLSQKPLGLCLAGLGKHTLLEEPGTVLGGNASSFVAFEAH